MEIGQVEPLKLRTKRDSNHIEVENEGIGEKKKTNNLHSVYKNIFYAWRVCAPFKDEYKSK